MSVQGGLPQRLENFEEGRSRHLLPKPENEATWSQTVTTFDYLVRQTCPLLDLFKGRNFLGAS